MYINSDTLVFFSKLLCGSSNILVDSGFRLKSKLNNVKYNLCECFCQRYYSPPTSSMPKLDSYYSTPPGPEENYDKINFFFQTKFTALQMQF
jgi:hypothetical protein